MDDVVRLLLRFVLVPLGYFVAALAGTVVILVASWRLLEIGSMSDPDGKALAVMGFVISGPVLFVFIFATLMLPASIGILISEAFAIRSWMFHVLNGVISSWAGWVIFAPMDGSKMPLEPTTIVAAGIAGGLAYWAVAGFNAGFWKPVFKRAPAGMPVTTSTSR
jgi:hypothetical protein